MGQIVPRSSYTIQNALRFRPAFNKAIETKTHVEVPCKNTSMSITTMKQRMSDALLYLANEIPDNVLKDPVTGEISSYGRIAYLQLRAEVRMRANPASDSVIIHFFRRNPLPSFDFTQIKESSLTTSEWRMKVTEFLNNDKPSLFLENLRLSAEDQLWVSNMLDGTGLEYDMKLTFIKILRGV